MRVATTAVEWIRIALSTTPDPFMPTDPFMRPIYAPFNRPDPFNATPSDAPLDVKPWTPNH